MAAVFRKLDVHYEGEHVSNIGRPFKIAEGTPVGFLGS